MEVTQAKKKQVTDLAEKIRPLIYKVWRELLKFRERICSTDGRV